MGEEDERKYKGEKGGKTAGGGAGEEGGKGGWLEDSYLQKKREGIAKDGQSDRPHGGQRGGKGEKENSRTPAEGKRFFNSWPEEEKGRDRCHKVLTLPVSRRHEMHITEKKRKRRYNHHEGKEGGGQGSKGFLPLAKHGREGGKRAGLNQSMRKKGESSINLGRIKGREGSRYMKAKRGKAWKKKSPDGLNNIEHGRISGISALSREKKRSRDGHA